MRRYDGEFANVYCLKLIFPFGSKKLMFLGNLFIFRFLNYVQAATLILTLTRTAVTIILCNSFQEGMIDSDDEENF